MIYHVVAMANGRVIGKDNKLPWHFSSDLKFFKNLTMGQTLLMGRKTFESIGKPLPSRENFVLSQSDFQQAGVKTFHSIDQAVKSVTTENGFIIGGGKIFNETLSLVDGIYLTRIHADYEGDTFYPEIPSHFEETSKTPLQDNPKLEVIFLRNRKKEQ